MQLADIAEALRSVAVKDRKKLIGHAVARHFDRAEPMLLRSRDLASRVGDRNVLAASANDLGNLYAQTGRDAQASKAAAGPVLGEGGHRLLLQHAGRPPRVLVLLVTRHARTRA